MTADSAAKSRHKRGRNSLLELVVIVAAAVGLALLIQAVLVKPYKIPSESMEPTLDIGQRVLVSRVTYDVGEPHRKDVVVFHPPVGAEENSECGVPHSPLSACPQPTTKSSSINFIKRIIGLPGDRITIKDGHPVINGKPLQESYALPCGGAPACNLPKPITVPRGHYFMMGDNRGASDDSRFWGPVPRDWLIGEAFFTYWPPNRVGTL